MSSQSLVFMFFVFSVLLHCMYSNNDDSNNHPSGSNDHQGTSGPGGGGGENPGECGGSSSGKLTVILSFESLNSQSQTFFIKQVKPVFEEFSKCVQWHFIPCSTSQIVQDVLQCVDGVAECQVDVLHACAAHYYEKDEYKLGKFFICMMTNENQYVKGEACAKEAGLDWKILNACQPSKDAGTWCDNRYKQLNELHEPCVPGVIYNWKYNKEADDESVMCLKTGICNQIKKNNMQCAACGNSSGGNPNGPDHGQNTPPSSNPSSSNPSSSGPSSSGPSSTPPPSPTPPPSSSPH